MRSAIISFVGSAMLFTSIAGCSGSNTSQVATNTPPGPVLQNTQYTQVERLARPAVKEAFELFESHDVSNRTGPYNDPTLAANIQSFTSNFRAPAYGATLAAVLVPDVIKFDTSQTGNAAYLGVETGGATGSKVGGRDLQSDVIDISLGAIFGTTLSSIPSAASPLVPADGKDDPCLANENLPTASNPGAAGASQYQTTAQIATSKHESATFPYLGNPN